MSDKVLMPKKLSADNGAKYKLIGEFNQHIKVICPACDNDEDKQEDCEVCNYTGEFAFEVPVSWTTIKAIYAKAVALFGEEQQQ